jgi:signal transduction histidine kinase
LRPRSAAAAGREEAVELGALAADCVTDLRARAEEAEVRMSAELQPAWTRGDPALLERMIANLIENGIRHNEQGGHLSVSTHRVGDKVRVIVSNGGPVIDPEVAPKLTEPFRRLERGTDGLGLGLSIVHSVVRAHGGTVAIQAPPTGGLEVRVELPATAGKPKVNVAEESRALTRK